MRDIFIHHQLQSREFERNGTKECFILLQEGRKIEVESVTYSTGGGATNTAVSFARLGFTTTAFCKVGNDCEGSAILSVLQQEKVNTSCMIKDTTIATGTSFIIPCPSGDRTVLVYRGANNTLEESELPLRLIDTMDIVYVTSLSGKTSSLLLPIARYAKQKNKKVAINPGTSQLTVGVDVLQASLPYIDILILNAHEAAMLACSLLEKKHLQKTSQRVFNNEQCLPTLLRQPLHYKDIKCNIVDYFAYTLAHGPSIAVVTNGAEGVYVATENTIYFHRSLPTQVISTLGAGDAFASCFVAQILQKKSIEDALICGIINSCSVLEYFDAKQGLLTAEQLQKHSTDGSPQHIQKYAISI